MAPAVYGSPFWTIPNVPTPLSFSIALNIIFPLISIQLPSAFSLLPPPFQGDNSKTQTGSHLVVPHIPSHLCPSLHFLN